MEDLYKELHTAVKAMRQAQKDYFKSRSPELLSYAKKCEAKVDELIRELETTTLFREGI